MIFGLIFEELNIVLIRDDFLVDGFGELSGLTHLVLKLGGDVGGVVDHCLDVVVVQVLKGVLEVLEMRFHLVLLLDCAS